uniref:Uncharacterized protein n=1 Tax=Astyanax mexicanus TaxID=7994 RepID=A0A3B1JE33_ASTMX
RFSFPFFHERRKISPTYDLHHTVLGLDGELLWGEVVDVQADLPALWGLLDLRHARAKLARQGAGVGRGVSSHGWAEVPGPVAAGKEWQLLWESWHAEGLVKQPAALVPVPEGVPGGAAQEGEGDASLGHSWMSLY